MSAMELPPITVLESAASQDAPPDSASHPGLPGTSSSSPQLPSTRPGFGYTGPTRQSSSVTPGIRLASSADSQVTVPRPTAPSTVTSGALDTPSPPASPRAFHGYKEEDIKKGKKNSQEVKDKYLKLEQEMSVSTDSSEEVAYTVSSSPRSSSPAPPGSSLRRATVLDCLASPRRAPPATPGLLPPSTPSCPAGPEKKKAMAVKRVQTWRKRQELKKKEEAMRKKEEARKKREEMKEQRKIEAEREKELDREREEVLDKEEGHSGASSDTSEEAEVTTSWREDKPWGSMGKTSFYEHKKKVTAVLEEYALQDQMDLVMSLAAARSMPTLTCPLTKEKLRIAVSTASYSEFLSSRSVWTITMEDAGAHLLFPGWRP